jgi:hypothetical protein
MMIDVWVHSAVQTGGVFAMEKQEKAELLKRMLFRIAPGDNVENVTTPRRDEELESVDRGPSPAETGLQKVKEGRHQELTDEEINGLEPIVLPRVCAG